MTAPPIGLSQQHKTHLIASDNDDWFWVPALCGSYVDRQSRGTYGTDLCDKCALLVGGTRFHVYRFYNAEGRLLYVGMTGDLWTRLGSHRNNSPWWSTVASGALASFTTAAEAAAAELAAIETEWPLHNKRDNPMRQSA